jgi:hypothetical protein
MECLYIGLTLFLSTCSTGTFILGKLAPSSSRNPTLEFEGDLVRAMSSVLDSPPEEGPMLRAAVGAVCWETGEKVM